MLCALAAAALLLGGCAQGQGKMAYIGADAAKKQILAEIGLDESQVKINSVDMATKNGMDYYRVELTDENGNTYRYDIEALTGKVIESAGADAAETTAAAAETGEETTAAVARTGEETTAAVARTGEETTAAAARTGEETTAAAAESGTGTTAAAAKTGAATTAATAETLANRIAAASGTAAAAGENAEKLTAEKAKAKALAHAGLSASRVTFTKAQLDWDDGKQVYDVEFFGDDGIEYDYEIDAKSGAVLSADKELEDRRNQTGSAPAGNGTSGGGTAGSGTSRVPAVQQTLPAADAGGVKLTVEEAKTKALAHAGLSASQVRFTKAEPDRDDGRATFDIEFYGNDGTEYEYEIDANTGEVIQHSTEAPETQSTVLQSAGGSGSGYTILAEESAKQLALAQVPGAAMSDITEFETDRDDGRIVYEGTIRHDGMEYEFEIDGYSGAFRKWECEQDDDHHDSHH